MNSSAPEISDLRKKLASEEPETRRLAARELPKIDAVNGAALLACALGDTDWRVRKEAVIAAAHMMPRAPVLAALSAALEKKDDIGLRNAAVEALRSLGKDAVSVAGQAFASLDADGRKLAVEVLAGIADDAGMPTLARALADEDTNVRIAAAEALARFSGASGARADAIALLTRTLDASISQNESEAPLDVRLACLRSIDALGASLSIAALEPHLADAVLRPAALRLLARTKEKRATLLAATALADSSATVVKEAARVLYVRIMQANEEELAIVSRTLAPATAALTRLRALAKSDADAEARSGAMLSLALVQSPDDAPLFVDALAEDAVAEAAEHALKLYGQNDSSALLSATRTAAPTARGAAISIVPQVARDGDAISLGILRDALSEAEPDVVIAALRGLSQVGQAEDLARTLRLTSVENASVSLAAAHALAALTELWPEEAARTWVRAQQDDDATLSGCVLAACAPRADATKEDLAARVAYLIRGSGNPDARVRATAIEGLGGFPNAPDAKVAVTFAVADEEPSAALAAVRSLAALGDEDALTHVILRSKDASLLGAAFDALRRFSEGHAEIARRLLGDRLARETDDTIRAAITFTLAHAEPDA